MSDQHLRGVSDDCRQCITCHLPVVDAHKESARPTSQTSRSGSSAKGRVLRVRGASREEPGPFFVMTVIAALIACWNGR